MVKKYLFFIYDMQDGGAQRVVSVLSNVLTDKGFEVHIGLYVRSENDYFLSEKVHVHQLKSYSSGNKLMNSLQRVADMSNLIKTIAPNIVIGMMGSVLIEGFFAAKRRVVPYVSAIRVDPARLCNEGMMGKLTLVVHRLSDAVFVQNEAQKAFYPVKMHNKIFSVFNPVSPVFLEKAYSEKPKIRKIAASGRLVKQKNHKMLIDAVSAVALHAPDVLLTIYGSGPLEAELKEYILSCKAEKNVVLAGRCSNMADALLENDLFVLSSDYEGMPNALLEAMALGMPCISTDCPTGPSEMIRNEESGILTPVQDSKMLEAAIMSVMKDSHRAYEMGQKARMFVLDQCVDTRVAEKFIRCTEPYCK